MSTVRPTLAVLGGTGAEGAGLAFRWLRDGYPVIVGSRDVARAEVTAKELGNGAQGMTNVEAAKSCDIAILTVPFAAQKPTLSDVKDALAGKLLVDDTVPLVPPRVARVQLPPEGSAAQAAQSVLGDDVRVVSAFQSVSAHHLRDPDYEIECDVLICGDDPGAREQVVRLAEAAGMRGLHAGELANAAASEALTSVLIAMNRRYKVPSTGIRITGLAEDPAV